MTYVFKKGKTIRRPTREIIRRVINECDLEARQKKMKYPLTQCYARAANYTGCSEQTLAIIREEGAVDIDENATEMIIRILNQCEKEAHEGKFHHALSQSNARVSYYTGCSERSITTIRRESAEAGEKSLSTPGTTRPRSEEFKMFCDETDKKIIREIVQNFYLMHNAAPTGPQLLAAIKEKINFPWKVDTLRRLLRQMGFDWNRSARKNGEQIKWITENLSSGDSCPSELDSADILAFQDETSFSLEDVSLSGTSSTCSREATGTPPPKRMKMATSQHELSIPQAASVHHSLPMQDNKMRKEQFVNDELSSASESIQSEFDDIVLETKEIDADLNRLEAISDKINKLNGRDDNLDNFGRFVTSLLRCLPFQRAIELQHEVITLILRSHINLIALEDATRPRHGSSSLQDKRTLPETSSAVALKPPSTTSALTLEIVGNPLSTSQRYLSSLETLIEQNDLSIEPSSPLLQDNKGGKRCPQRRAPCEDKATAQSSSVNQSLSLHQHKNSGNKRLQAESETSSELQNKQNRFDELLQTIRIEAVLKKLECISDNVKQLYRMDDHFDNFATYAASLLKWLPTLRAMELQQEVINLILKLHINPLLQVQ